MELLVKAIHLRTPRYGDIGDVMCLRLAPCVTCQSCNQSSHLQAHVRKDPKFSNLGPPNLQAQLMCGNPPPFKHIVNVLNLFILAPPNMQAHDECNKPITHHIPYKGPQVPHICPISRT